MKYTKEHEWLRVEGDLVVVGITEHAATALGDVVFVELPEMETVVAEGDEVVVKCINIDRDGKIRLSRKQALDAAPEDIHNFLT